MKTLNKKNIVLVVLSFVLALSMLAFAGSVKPVHASNENITHFVMMDESSLRLDGQASGLRFRVQMDEATAYYVKGYDKETQTTNNDNGVTMGFLIAPKVYFDRAIQNAADKTNIDYFSALPAYVGDDGVGIIAKDATKDNVYLGEDDNYYANGVVGTLREGNVDLEFAAIAYIKDGTNVTFATRNEDFARTYKETASKAVLSGNNKLSDLQGAAYLTDFGTETNPIQINDDADMDLALNSGDAYADLSIAIMTKDTSSSSSSATSSVPFKGELGLTPTANTIASGTYSATPSFAEGKDFPSDVDQGWGYTGDAIKYSIEAVASNKTLYVTMNYTAEEYAKIIASQENPVNAVKFSYLVDTDSTKIRNVSTTSKEGVHESWTLLSGAGYHYTSIWTDASVLRLPLNMWQTECITLDAFYEALTDNQLKVGFVNIHDGNAYHETDIYLGNIEFVSMEEDELANWVSYKGEVGLSATADNLSRVTSNKPTEVVVSYVSNADIPTKNHAGEDIDNSIDFTGNAFKFSDVVHNKYGYFTMNYTTDEYKALAKQNGYTAVKFSYMVDPINATLFRNNTQYKEDTGTINNFSLFATAGYIYYDYIAKGADKDFRKFELNKWVTCVVDIEEFYKVYQPQNSDKYYLSYFSMTSDESADFYFGGIEFIADPNVQFTERRDQAHLDSLK